MLNHDLHKKCTPNAKQSKAKQSKAKQGKARQSKAEQSNVCPQLRQPTPVCKLCQLGGSVDQAFDWPDGVVKEGDIGVAAVAS